MTDIPAQTPAPEQPPAQADASAPPQETGDASVVADEAAKLADAPEQPKPVVGDYLKMQFVEHRVVPTILGFFFRYPWNNFLHNVVYDIVQQVFNGPMDRGYNPTLAISLFEAADVTNQIIKGQLASEKSQTENKTRMGYMGHLTLIAEEVVKFTERHPPELLSESVLEKVMAQDWVSYVEGALAETRERDNAILGGVRPEVAMSRASGQGLMGGGFSGLNSIGLGGGASSALADAGLNGGSDVAEGSGGSGVGPFAISAGTLMSGFGSSSDEDEDEEQDTEEDVNNEVRGDDSLYTFQPDYDFLALLTGSAPGQDGAGGVQSDTGINEQDYDQVPDAWKGPGSCPEQTPISLVLGFSRMMCRLGERYCGEAMSALESRLYSGAFCATGYAA
jgi:SIT4-associating protein SAP185/190